ncbi:MAG TPA: hypothetical protein DCQ84_10580, partial [Candidatus Competibacteraceae bacterium]|nr:hypothetical protein [Candidatus Competibacteraceae bacterium]
MNSNAPFDFLRDRLNLSRRTFLKTSASAAALGASGLLELKT